MKEVYRVGQRFNHWVLLRKLPAVNRNRKWLCMCDCGGQKVLDLGNVVSGKSRQCASCAAKRRQERERRNKNGE